jgi:hypothetical protein
VSEPSGVWWDVPTCGDGEESGWNQQAHQEGERKGNSRNNIIIIIMLDFLHLVIRSLPILRVYAYGQQRKHVSIAFWEQPWMPNQLYAPLRFMRDL